MNAMTGGTNYHMPQTIFQHMMGGQQNADQDSPEWMQMPQVPPMSMPWSVQTSQSNIIRFGEGRPQINYGFGLHQKRKLELADLIEPRQQKQFITEEKMAEHFQELHISSKNTVPVEPVPSTSTAFDPIGNICNKINLIEDLDMDGPTVVDSETKKGPRLVMSEELKRLQQEPLLPSSLLSKLERPAMALVLWEPPNKHLRLLSNPQDTPTPIPNDSEEENNNSGNNVASASENSVVNNNNESIPNLNAMITDVDVPLLEPMDL